MIGWHQGLDPNCRPPIHVSCTWDCESPPLKTQASYQFVIFKEEKLGEVFFSQKYGFNHYLLTLIRMESQSIVHKTFLGIHSKSVPIFFSCLEVVAFVHLFLSALALSIIFIFRTFQNLHVLIPLLLCL